MSTSIHIRKIAISQSSLLCHKIVVQRHRWSPCRKTDHFSLNWYLVLKSNSTYDANKRNFPVYGLSDFVMIRTIGVCLKSLQTCPEMIQIARTTIIVSFKFSIFRMGKNKNCKRFREVSQIGNPEHLFRYTGIFLAARVWRRSESGLCAPNNHELVHW